MYTEETLLLNTKQNNKIKENCNKISEISFKSLTRFSVTFINFALFFVIYLQLGYQALGYKLSSIKTAIKLDFHRTEILNRLSFSKANKSQILFEIGFFWCSITNI